MNMHIAILGRQPALSMAELESLYGEKVRWFSDIAGTIDSASFSIDHLGGTQKAGRVTLELRGDWRQVSQKIAQTYAKKWAAHDGKITLGISAYGFTVSSREVQKVGIVLKNQLKKSGVSLRLIPNPEPALNTATSHHNKLGLASNKVELLVVRARDGRVIVAESIGAQNITQLARRDQNRPKRDAFVGMLPPKLAQIMINLASLDGGESLDRENERNSNLRLLDPFCGTGVILQEAALQGYAVYGTDLSDKMIDYTTANLDWLAQTHRLQIKHSIHQADARTATWQQPINLVVCEGYLGQPFSAPPSPSKLTEVRGNCNQIISDFLQNIGTQITPGTPLCVAVPAWRSVDGSFTHLPLINSLEQLGYRRCSFKTAAPSDLLYYRENQVVARELLVLVKT
jgi:tRNA G10  N-methylase Trm11